MSEKDYKIRPTTVLAADAVTLVLVGIDTLSYTLVVVLFNLLDSRPDVLGSLRDEIRPMIDERTKMAEWGALEKIPLMVGMREISPILARCHQG